MYEKIKDIFDVLGGPSATAREVTEITGSKCDPRTVGMWRQRGSVPFEARPVLDQAITRRIDRALAKG